MKYIIFDGEREINRIEATPEFIQSYAESTGYTAQDIAEEPAIPQPDEVALLKAQVAAMKQSNQMLEDCLVEMASVVYA